jgi:hypothetical protein
VSGLDPTERGWTKLGSSDNAEFFEVEEGIVAIVPHEGCTDDAETATQSVEFQHAHWRDKGRPGGAIIFLDRVRDSQPGAREVYSKLPDPSLIRGFALVGGTVFGRAVASVFMGLSPPSAPTRMFGSLDKALCWLRERSAGG